MSDTEMIWTKEPPREIGHYWWRPYPSDQVADYRVYLIDWNLSREPYVLVGSHAVPPSVLGGEWWPEPLAIPR